MPYVLGKIMAAFVLTEAAISLYFYFKIYLLKY